MAGGSKREAPLRIGVWIQLPPYARWRTEGIGRLTGYIIAGTVRTGATFVLVAPPWMEEELTAFIAELPAHARPSVSFRTSAFSRVRWETALEARLTARGKPRRPSALRRWLTGVMERPSYRGLLLGVVALVLFKLGRLLNPVNWMRALARWSQLGSRLRERARRSTIGEFVSMSTLISAEINANARFADRQSDIDVWLTPYPGFTAAAGFRKPVTLILPDFVLADYPEGFPQKEAARLQNQFRGMVEAASRVISFTEDVRSRHVIGLFGVPSEKTRVIPHCVVDISDVWSGPDPRERGPESVAFAKEMIRAYGAGLLSSRKDVRDARMWGALVEKTDFESLTYAFCPQQARPYKNLTLLAEAAAYLNRVKGTPFHVVVSSFVDSAAEGDPLVATLNRLNAWQYFTFAPGLPADVHAAFYHLADMSIHPSFFEGGLSFILGESISMGAPCLLSRNAANVEALAGSPIEDLLFDPSSVRDLANKVSRVLDDREGVLARQRAWAADVNGRRGWDQVALEYLDVLRTSRAPRRPARS